MTLEEDVALLREEVARLRVIDRDKSRRLEDLESQVAVWNVNGADGLLGGYGFTRIGQYYLFTDVGLQVNSDDETVVAGAGLRGIAWVPKFVISSFANELTASPNAQFSQIRGNADNTDNWVALRSERTDVSDKWVELFTYCEGTNAYIILQGNNGGTAGPNISFFAQTATAVASLVLNDVILYPKRDASDPALTISDGAIWYRTDTDKFRGRANGATDNFAMEGWVTSTFAPISITLGLIIATNNGYGEF